MAQKFIVEGNDAIALAVMCQKRGVRPPQSYENPKIFEKDFVVKGGSDADALKKLQLALNQTTNTNIGIILDAEQKALLHTWLAWQETPGKPFGQAIQANYMNVQVPVANDFIQWFSQTFELAP